MAQTLTAVTSLSRLGRAIYDAEILPLEVRGRGACDRGLTPSDSQGHGSDVLARSEGTGRIVGEAPALPTGGPCFQTVVRGAREVQMADYIQEPERHPSGATAFRMQHAYSTTRVPHARVKTQLEEQHERCTECSRSDLDIHRRFGCEPRPIYGSVVAKQSHDQVRD